MALTPEQEKVKAETAEKVAKGLEDGVAAILKENYKSLQVAFPTLADAPQDSKETNKFFRSLARQAIDDPANIKFKARDGSEECIDIDDINGRLMQNKEAGKLITGRGAKHLSDLVFTREQVNLIANEAGEAAAENTGPWRGTTRWNATKGVINYVWTLGEDGSTAAPAANSVRSDVIDRLNKLAETQPGIRLILGEDGITKIADAMHKGVVDKAAGKETGEDPLDKVEILEVSDALRKQVSSEIHRQTYEAARTGITQRVNEEMDKVRNGGDGSFWGMIKGFIFRLAEIFGAEKWLAGMFGMPIPGREEINEVARTVADSVSETVANGKGLSKEALGRTVEQNVDSALNGNRALASFNKEQLAEIAGQAARSIMDKYDDIPMLDRGPAYAAARKAVDPNAEVSDPQEASREDNKIPTHVAVVVDSPTYNKFRDGV